MEGKQRGSNQRSLFLLISPWTAVSTCHSYSSTLGKVERWRIDAFLSVKRRLPGQDTCTDASVQRLCANWVEKMGRTSRGWWTVWGAWDSRKDRNIRGIKTYQLNPKTHTMELGIRKEWNFQKKMCRNFMRTSWPSTFERRDIKGLVVTSSLSSSVRGSTQSRAGPDTSISAVHCCECWLTRNAVRVRNLLFPSSRLFVYILAYCSMNACWICVHIWRLDYNNFTPS